MNKNCEVVINYKRIKNIYFKVKENKLIISAPWYVPKIYIKSLVRKKEQWIKQKLKNQQNKQQDRFYFLGKKYKFEKINSNTDKVEIQENKIIIYAKNNDFDEVYREFELQQAKIIFDEYIKKYSKIVKIPIEKVKLKYMTSRWGSCNYTKRYINLNINLIKKPKEFIEYVILHELTHLIHPNHSKDFYDFIFSHMKDYKNRIIANR